MWTYVPTRPKGCPYRDDDVENEGGVPSRLIEDRSPRKGEKGRHAMVDVRTLGAGEKESEEIVLTLDQLAREGARRMIAAALRAEADEYLARF